MKPFFHAIPICALACAGAFLTLACTPSDGKIASYLLIEQAERQPVSTTLGTIVVLQQRGGKFLRMKTPGGTLQLPSDAPDAEARNGACLAALPDDELGFYTIVPANGECVLSVELLAEGPNCTGTVIQNKILPVSTTRTAVDATTSTSGAGSTGGTGGAGGTSATSSGTTGTGGAGGK